METQELKRLQALCDAATLGPYRVQMMGRRLGVCGGDENGKAATPICHVHRSTKEYAANAALVIEARTVMPTLIAQVLELQEKLEKQKEQHRDEVISILRDMRLPMIDHRDDPNSPLDQYDAGRNVERREVNNYCNQKVFEYTPTGLGPDPVTTGQW